MGIRGIPAAHGGFETFAQHLVLFLRDRGWSVSVYCQGSASGRHEEDEWQGVRRIHIPVRSTGAVGTIEFDVKCVANVAARPGMILTLGYNTGFLALWLRLRGRINCINMDGIEWRRDKYALPAKAWLWLNERLAAFSATSLLADHPRIEERVRRIAPWADVTMIPYGGDRVADTDPAPLAAMGLHPGNFFTLIARPEPENSVAEVIAAFSAERTGAKLVVLGHYDPSIPYHADILATASADILFAGPLYDEPTLHALRCHSIAYFHGHKVGGTNPSLVEALAAGNPVIAHDNMFNRWVAGDAALYFTDVDSCRAALRRVMSEMPVRRNMAAAALHRWREDFLWPTILQAYETLLLRLASPSAPAVDSANASAVRQVP